LANLETALKPVSWHSGRAVYATPQAGGDPY
jgi:hypothetical protein